MSLLTIAGQGALTGTPTPKQRLAIAFSKKLLERLEKMNPTPFLKFNESYPIQQNTGNQIVITLTQALTISTTALTDGTVTPADAAFSTSTITMTLAFYGNDIGWSTLFDLTSSDIAKETHSKELAMNARETMTQLVVDDMDAISVSYAGAMTFARAVGAARTLKANRVRGYDEIDGHYVGAIGPLAWEDLSTEASAAYKDHYQVQGGNNLMAEGQLSKPAADIQFYVTNYNKAVSTQESEYFWGEGALAHTEINAGIAGANGRAIGLPNVASLVGYLIPAEASLADVYALRHHSVWRAGPIDFAVADANRITVLGITT